MDSAFKKLIYWSGHTHSLLGLAVHQPIRVHNRSELSKIALSPSLTLLPNLIQIVYFLLNKILFSTENLSQIFNIAFKPHILGHDSVISSAYDKTPI